MSHSAPLAPGEALGRYRLESVLGTGGMATVWKASDERLGRTVAVKVLSETLALDRDFVERFRREAKVAAGLSHPNLVTVFDFEADGPRPYLVSEYVEGGTLADRLDSGERIDAETLAAQLLEALAHIHRAGVIHRDVKPANLLIDRDGRSRLTDFGIAQPQDATQLTDAGKVLGTLAYMAPEVRAGGKATERSDLYGAGVLLAELSPGDSGAVRSLAGRLSAEDPGARPASAEDALRMLHSDTAETVPVGAAALPPTERRPVIDPAATTRLLGPGPRRRRAALGLGVLIALAAGLLLATSLGGDDGGAPGAGVSAEQAKTAPPAGEPAPGAQTEPATQDTPAATPQAPSASDSCRALEQQQQALAGAHGPNGAQDKALKDQLKEQEKALGEQLKACVAEGPGAGGKKGD